MLSPLKYDTSPSLMLNKTNCFLFAKLKKIAKTTLHLAFAMVANSEYLVFLVCSALCYAKQAYVAVIDAVGAADCK